MFIIFIFGITDLYNHKHRYNNDYPTTCYLCPICKGEDEDEEHFILRCPALYDLRMKYIVPHVHPDSSDVWKE